ncbi:thioesterase [Paraneptunicella aestuarii]|uniref:thioesterase II family protein n=1 Tax=Paraneptunicella aestuarii TaxID=2831148 RepID=UPI001E2D6EB6|nr:alpha/beta fold hydrolase [Paraneptunicella aestuarii]UAA40452.1 thioesterase [Paraneptunicella aestuarii]
MFIQHPAVTKIVKETPVSPKVRVIAFPFAGSNGNVFLPWKEHLGEHVEVLAYTPPGRAGRFQDGLINSMEKLVQDAWQHMGKYLDKPYILFGHSLGSLIAYEFMLKAQKYGFPAPIHFISSARKAPHLPSMENWTGLSDKDFIEHLDDLGGLHPDIAAVPELLDLLLPVLRADIEVVETYQPTSKEPNSTLATIFGGEDDDRVPLNDLQVWQEYFQAPININMVDAGHFYLDSHAKELTGFINKVALEAS